MINDLARLVPEHVGPFAAFGRRGENGLYTQYLRVVVGQIRHKLEVDPAQPVLIQTEPAIGYRLTA